MPQLKGRFVCFSSKLVQYLRTSFGVDDPDSETRRLGWTHLEASQSCPFRYEAVQRRSFNLRKYSNAIKRFVQTYGGGRRRSWGVLINGQLNTRRWGREYKKQFTWNSVRFE
jgi:hypothetical protein